MVTKALTHNTAYCITNNNEERFQIYATKYIKSVLLILIYTCNVMPLLKYIITHVNINFICPYKQGNKRCERKGIIMILQ